MEKTRLRKSLDAIDPEWNVPGIDVVHKYVKRASSDIELCYTLGEILDRRRQIIGSLVQTIETISKED